MHIERKWGFSGKWGFCAVSSDAHSTLHEEDWIWMFILIQNNFPESSRSAAGRVIAAGTVCGRKTSVSGEVRRG